MQITYETMKQMFPKVRHPKSTFGNRAQFGPIPMSFFVEHEKEIRKLALNRIIYRGPRRVVNMRKRYLGWTAETGHTHDYIKQYANMTRRADATHALVY